MREPEYIFFPLRNEADFKVDSLAAYKHMIGTIIGAQLQLSEDYPDDIVMVIYEVAELGE